MYKLIGKKTCGEHVPSSEITLKFVPPCHNPAEEIEREKMERE